ncbi:hypothetical protein BHS09_33750 [Myxococcus xanthus]|uniref:SbsA Ig-like domain-containing protein n=1 Tax=Myxococcus xanthus TaxID=34 RepID=A0AAE6KVI4_MYXXA|nr:hypothetical protein [Myxococcus xanthus]QDE71557.1 hypothetical protein BHS09_33750 [Myxococcus xanthus]QDE78838.1 hypothetical protein BHS08_33775 [Myxococcus xanthus]
MPRSLSLPSARSSLLIATLSLLGCGDLSDGTPPNHSPGDSMRLEINNARGMEHVNGSLLVTVQMQGGQPETVELFLDGALLATLLPPFEFTWDTTDKPEGIYQLQARTQWKGHTLMSPKHPVSVDRTGPVVVEASPWSTDLFPSHASTLQVKFSEPVRFARDEDVTASVRVNDRELTPRMSLAHSGLLVFAPIGVPDLLPAEGSASLPLGNITDLAGNPAQFNPEKGPRYSWTWSVPLFMRDPMYLSTWSPGLGYTPLSVVGRPALAVGPDGDAVLALADVSGQGQHDGAKLGTHIVVGRQQQRHWQQVGEPVVVPGASEAAGVSDPLLALGSDGHPVIAFQHHESAHASPALHVFQWVPPTWQPLGGRLNAPEAAELSGASLVVDSEGRPVVAWSAADGIRVQRWEADQWRPLGAVQRVGMGPEATVSTGAPALSVDGSGGVFLAWAEAESSEVGAGLYVRHWNGSGWVAVGGRLIHEGLDALNHQVSEPALATTPDGRPVAVWAELDARAYHQKVVVAQWSGAAWDRRVVTSAEHSFQRQGRRCPSVAVDAEGRALVTFIGGDSTQGTYVSWYARGALSTDLASRSGHQTYSTLALDVAGQPVIAVSYSGSLSIYRPNQ